MNKYIRVISNTIQYYFFYRINFLLWRIRIILSVLLGYFLWMSIFQAQTSVFGYDKPRMLTYMLLLTVINGFVLSSRTTSVADEIVRGKLSDLLIRPINYFWYIFSCDIADKIVNAFFSCIEIILLMFFLRPPFIIPTNPGQLIGFFVSIILAGILYFEIGMILSFIAFWSRDTWAIRFIFFILVSFLAGIYFPLDILPKPFFWLSQLLPFSYLGYFPLKLYLGSGSGDFLIRGFFTISLWIISLWICMMVLWKKGLQIYTAEGK